jgi:hypothetical protein
MRDIRKIVFYQDQGEPMTGAGQLPADRRQTENPHSGQENLDHRGSPQCPRGRAMMRCIPGSGRDPRWRIGTSSASRTRSIATCRPFCQRGWHAGGAAAYVETRCLQVTYIPTLVVPSSPGPPGTPDPPPPGTGARLPRCRGEPPSRFHTWNPV